MGTKVGITDQERQLSYAKYYDRELAPIAEELLTVAAGEGADGSLALPVEEKNEFLKGNSKLKVGFAVAPNGSGLVANKMFMKDVTVDMLDWWFGWHSVGSDLRYKIWDPEDHYYARADKPEYVVDPSVPCNQKSWGMNHSIKEDIGLGAEDLLLCFRRPSFFGYDESLLGTKECASMVCAYGVGKTPAFMSHKWYPVDGGVMFESHFWMGYTVPEGSDTLVKVIPDGVAVPIMGPKALFNHTIKEYTNLAAILPELYAEEKDNWL